MHRSALFIILFYGLAPGFTLLLLWLSVGRAFRKAQRRDRIAGGALIAMALVLSASSTWAQRRTWITIDAAGKERGAFVPRAVPYTQGGPSVGVYLVDRQDVRMPDGRILTGLDFIGWSEGAGTRVQVFALVPKDGIPNTYLPGGDARNLVRRDYATYRLAPGQSRPIAEMRALGIEPMVVRSVARTSAVR